MKNSDRHGTSNVGASQRAPARIFTIVLAVASLLALAAFIGQREKLFTFPASISAASGEDTVAFWRASQMALTGEAAAAYDRKTFQTPLTPPNDGLVWWNPPHAFFLVGPFALAPYGVVKAFWVAASLAALALIGRTADSAPPAPKNIANGMTVSRVFSENRFLQLALVLSPTAFVSLAVMQSGPFIALGLASALLLAKRRPILAGVILALLTVKPQYGLMAPVFLAATGAWRTFGAAAAATVALAIASAAVFGVDAWRAFLDAPTTDYVTGGAYRGMISVSHTLLKLGVNNGAAVAAQFVTIIACAIVVWRAARRADRSTAVGVTLIASAVAAPVVWIYDWALIIGGLLMLRPRITTWPATGQTAAAIVWLAPLYWIGVDGMWVSYALPIVMLAALAAATQLALGARGTLPSTSYPTASAAPSATSSDAGAQSAA